MRRRALGPALALLCLAACTGDEPVRPNVVLITIDTLRSDHSSVHGYANDTTPHLAELARAGAIFETAYAPAPQTGPTHASIFSGLYPVSHGLVKNGLDLGEGHETLAEVFGAAGYQTAGFVSSFVLEKRFGWAQGFEHYRDEFSPEASTIRLEDWEGHAVDTAFDARAGATTERVVEWLEQARDAERPFFLFVHYFDPHDPYEPPADFAERFPLPAAGAGVKAMRKWRKTVRAYDGEIAFADAAVGRLLEALDARGLTKESLVVVTSDHGEGLADHDFLFHGLQLYEEAVRVPLIFRWPGEIEPGRRLAGLVSLVDLHPTLLDLARIDRRGRDLQGISLAPFLLGEAEVDPDRAIYLQRRPFEPGRAFGIKVAGEQFGIRVGKWKYVDAEPEGRTALFDLERDAGEQENLLAAEPEQAARLAEQLAGWRRAHRREPVADEIDPEERRALEALGYVP